jgi:hypothetical protein
MEGFEFKENSKAMFDDVCNLTPWLVRHFTRNGMVNGLKARGCGAVTESIMYDVCREVTPAKYLDRTIEVLDKDKTT